MESGSLSYSSDGALRTSLRLIGSLGGKSARGLNDARGERFDSSAARAAGARPSSGASKACERPDKDRPIALVLSASGRAKLAGPSCSSGSDEGRGMIPGSIVFLHY